MRASPFLSLAILVVLAPRAYAAGEAGELDPALYRACVEELPKELSGALDSGAAPRRSWSGPEGRWTVEPADLNGDGVEEAFLVALPAGHGGEVTFLYHKDGTASGEWETKRVKLGGGPVTEAAVRVTPVGEGRSLAHVDGGEGGQALLAWHDGKLDTVWKVGRSREGERRWFVLEDLDGNGVDEVVEYFQRELDVFFADEDDLEDGAAGGATSQVDAVAVYRLDGGSWKKDRDLLESRRRR